MANEIPGAVLTVIDDAGHLVNIEKPAEFNAAVLAFLDRHRGG
jgi:pimeloyl-ACP methyl ester carboxylesterase